MPLSNHCKYSDSKIMDQLDLDRIEESTIDMLNDWELKAQGIDMYASQKAVELELSLRANELLAQGVQSVIAIPIMV